MPVPHARRKVLVAIGLIGALSAAGCSSSSSGTGGSANPSGSAGGAKSKHLTIGFVEITEAAPVVVQTADEFKRGAALLGWDVKVVNANADPAQMAAGVSSMVTQNVDAIVTMAIPPAAAATGLAAAKAKGIPTITVGAPIDDPNKLYDVAYAPDDTKMATLVADQMVKDLNSKGQILEFKASAQKAIALRTEALKAALSGTTITSVVTHETDLTNPVQDTQNTTTNALRAHPDIAAVWGPQDFNFAAAYKAINAQNSKAGVYSIYLDPEDFPILRAHTVPMAIADSPLMDVSWYALDSLVNKFLLNKSDWITSVDVHPLPYVLVTPANVPATDKWPYEDFAPFFTDRWKTAGVAVS